MHADVKQKFVQWLIDNQFVACNSKQESYARHNFNNLKHFDVTITDKWLVFTFTHNDDIDYQEISFSCDHPILQHISELKALVYNTIKTVISDAEVTRRHAIDYRLDL